MQGLSECLPYQKKNVAIIITAVITNKKKSSYLACSEESFHICICKWQSYWQVCLNNSSHLILIGFLQDLKF